VKWSRNIVLGAVVVVVLIAVLGIVALGIAPDSSQSILEVPTASPSRCKALIDEYFRKNRAGGFDYGTGGPGTSGFIDCPID